MRWASKRLAVLLVLGATQACAADAEPLPGENTAPLTVEQRAAMALEHAVLTWADAVGWAPAVDSIRFEVPADDADRTTAMWDAETSTLVLVPMRIGSDQHRWEAVVMHEVGHAYGLGHVADPTAVMNAIPNTTACVHESDAAELERVLHVKAKPSCS